jgi:anti-sigma factor RsiW
MILRANKKAAEQAAITRLADGSATDAERARIEAAVARSPELAAELAEQRRVVAMLASLDVGAPATLHQRVVAPEPRTARRRLRPTGRIAIVTVVLIALVVFAIARPVGHANMRSVVAIALATGDGVPPGVSPHDHALLGVAIDRVVFPNWSTRGWRTSGSRIDTLGGQHVETVYYTAEGYERVGYAIVGGAALRITGARRAATRAGVSYWTIPDGKASVVTWRRDGHTCVLASRHAPVSALIALASMSA